MFLNRTAPEFNLFSSFFIPFAQTQRTFQNSSSQTISISDAARGIKRMNKN